MVRAAARKTAIASVLVVAGLIGTSVAADAALPPPVAPTLPTVPVAQAPACPDQIAPPPAVDASEVPVPGQVSPTPVPEPRVPAGGPRMAECGDVLPAGAPALPADLAYASWVLQDLDTGAVLAARDPHARQRPASVIKLLLARVVAGELNPAAPVVGTADDANQDGTRVGIGPGGQYSVGLLLDALLLASGNDAAHALAMQLGGMPATVEKMNTAARGLGMLDTRVASPSGLDAPGMSTSAYDLSVVFRADMATPLIANAVHTQQVPFPGYGTKPGFVVNNDNLLLRTYSGDLGGKNGYTTDAQETYANAAVRDGHRVALVMLRGTNRLAGKWQNARELMDYGFALENVQAAPVGFVVVPNPAAATVVPSANNVAKSVPTTGHGGAQVAAVPQGSISAFGNVGLPLTILAGIALVLIGMLYLKRQKSKRARAMAAARAASAETVRVALPADLARTNGHVNGAVPTQKLPTTAPTGRPRPPVAAPVNGRPVTRSPRPNGVPAANPQFPAAPRQTGPVPEWPTGPEWPR
jgi:D-alanyl-D-alanine carboxypeptidase (penicillin-binding protein 5/6)